MPYRKKQINFLQIILQSRIFRIILLIIFIFLALQVYEQYLVMKKTAEKKLTTETAHQQLLNEKKELKQKVANTGGEYGIEKEIRTNFDMQREGEQVVLILEESTSEIPKRTGPDYSNKETVTPWYIFWD